ncbi:hypothetical protein PFC_03090 [Pyrococcus furiosus COM1]|uniref:Uncharacterized protein n=1 Tax=Pyrococcus furiosus COM1 TaxID=1185654 RepID=I6UP62_9EURY|nr:hypothetical protein [Pyrococcus furiosus]AFN03571.1 hypothetical protein PFC_03090 [Pyrococcus furiosus COM1]
MHSHCDDVCIGILTNYGLNSDGGGVKVYTKNLVDALKELGVDYAILMREGDPTEKEIKLPENKILYVARL